MKACPLCGDLVGKYPAISRKDNKLQICSDCGVVEALSDYIAAQRQKVVADLAKIDAFFGQVDERQRFAKDYYEDVKERVGK